MKYINADRLREMIAEQMKSLPREVGRGADTITSKGYGMIQAFQIMRSIIDSLQEEEKSVAERFARIVRGNLIGIDKEVQQKFEQLYFEITGNKMYGGYND